jgi:hypothetical protein
MGAAFSLNVPEISLAPLPQGEGKKTLWTGTLHYETARRNGFGILPAAERLGPGALKAAGAEILQGEERPARIDSAFHVVGFV